MTSPEAVADTANLLSESGASSSSRRGGGGCCRRRNGGWFFVEPVLLLYCFNEFPMIIITQKYSLDWIGVNVFNSTSSGSSWPAPASLPSPCDPNITDSERRLSEKVQSLTSLFGLVEAAVFGVPALIVTIILGAGSDRFGRRHLSALLLTIEEKKL